MLRKKGGMPVGGSNTVKWEWRESTALEVIRMLAILVNRSEEMSTATHRPVVHWRFVGPCSYTPSSGSERSDDDDAESSFNSEYIGEERAMFPTSSPERVRGIIVKVQKASF